MMIKGWGEIEMMQQQQQQQLLDLIRMAKDL